MAPVLLAIGFIVTQAVERAMNVVERISSGEIPLDSVAIAQVLEEEPSGIVAVLLTIAKCTVLVCWIAAAVDAYRQGTRG